MEDARAARVQKVWAQNILIDFLAELDHSKIITIFGIFLDPPSPFTDQWTFSEILTGTLKVGHPSNLIQPISQRHSPNPDKKIGSQEAIGQKMYAIM